MSSSTMMTPHLETAYTGPLHFVENVILDQIETIEEWFEKEWKKTPPPITSSVDLRNAAFKLSPVDTNLFPAGFNNLNSEFLPLCIEAAKQYMQAYYPLCKRILILPENHTRNVFYFQSLLRLKEIFDRAGFLVRIGSLDESVHAPVTFLLDDQEVVHIEPIKRVGTRLELENFSPDFLLLNNDLASGIPQVLQGISQPIQPASNLGWGNRLKSTHFQHYRDVAAEFSKQLHCDPWFLTPMFSAVEGIDFMAQEGLDRVVSAVDGMLFAIRDQYRQHAIHEEPFVVVKADSGTYGMGVMMVQEGVQLQHLNRKQRKKLAATKGNQNVSKFIIQEGIHSIETMPNGAVVEPVVYLLGQQVIGGFYRAHKSHGRMEHLNAIGMYFEKMQYTEQSQSPRGVDPKLGRFYVYGVVARLAVLAAAREMQAVSGLTQNGRAS